MQNQLLIQNWINIQNNIKSKLQTIDVGSSAEGLNPYIGGMDISFIKESNIACASIVIIKYPENKVVHHHFKLTQVNVPYVAGFLAFRELPAYINLYNEFIQKFSQFKPRLFMIDGNGILHPNGLGLASHFGVIANVKTIGVAKNLHCIDGLTTEQVKSDLQDKTKRGEFSLLIGKSNGSPVYGAAVRTQNDTNPVFVSIGNRVSLKGAIDDVVNCSIYRIPEPTRLADQLSREILRKYTCP